MFDETVYAKCWFSFMVILELSSGVVGVNGLDNGSANLSLIKTDQYDFIVIGFEMGCISFNSMFNCS